MTNGRFTSIAVRPTPRFARVRLTSVASLPRTLPAALRLHSQARASGSRRRLLRSLVQMYVPIAPYDSPKHKTDPFGIRLGSSRERHHPNKV